MIRIEFWVIWEEVGMAYVCHLVIGYDSVVVDEIGMYKL